MTTPIVQSITDEQLAELEYQSEQAAQNPGVLEESDEELALMASLRPMTVRALIARLRAAEDDVARLNKLDALCEAYGCEGIHEGNRWTIDGPYRDIRAAVDDIPEHQP